MYFGIGILSRSITHYFLKRMVALAASDGTVHPGRLMRRAAPITVDEWDSDRGPSTRG
jgi:hypothetical protein